jgi:hypothetical protein
VAVESIAPAHRRIAVILNSIVFLIARDLIANTAAHDNGTFIVESFWDPHVDLTILVPQDSTLTNLVSGGHLAPLPPAKLRKVLPDRDYPLTGSRCRCKVTWRLHE